MTVRMGSMVVVFFFFLVGGSEGCYVLLKGEDVGDDRQRQGRENVVLPRIEELVGMEEESECLKSFPCSVFPMRESLVREREGLLEVGVGERVKTMEGEKESRVTAYCGKPETGRGS